LHWKPFPSLAPFHAHLVLDNSVTLPPRSGPDEIAITWLWHPMKSTTILLLAASLYAETAAPFAPLEEWKAAVMSGDQTALARLYSSNPPAVAQVG
jgi:hypothetical protein